MEEVVRFVALGKLYLYCGAPPCRLKSSMKDSPLLGEHGLHTQYIGPAFFMKFDNSY